MNTQHKGQKKKKNDWEKKKRCEEKKKRKGRTWWWLPLPLEKTSMPLRAKKMCGAAGVNNSSHVSGAKDKSLHKSWKLFITLCKPWNIWSLPQKNKKKEQFTTGRDKKQAIEARSLQKFKKKKSLRLSAIITGAS